MCRLDTLNILNTIQEIRGTLTIEQWSYSSFPYLSNLQILGSNEDPLMLPSECANGSRVPYSLFISNNPNLMSIDLSSLREIRSGGLYMHNNKELCLIGNLSSLVTNSSAAVCVTPQARKDPQACGKCGLWALGIRSSNSFFLGRLMWWRHSFRRDHSAHETIDR